MKISKCFAPLVAALVLLCALVCGCEPQVVVTSSGKDIIITNGVVYRHEYKTWDAYWTLSNAVPQ